MTTAEVLKQIKHYQNIQKKHRMDSAEWIESSKKLQPLFKAMSDRSKGQDSDLSRIQA